MVTCHRLQQESVECHNTNFKRHRKGVRDELDAEGTWGNSAAGLTVLTLRLFAESVGTAV